MSDGRIPVILPPHDAVAGDPAWITDAAVAPAGIAARFHTVSHAAFCACCGGRSTAAQAFSRLHLSWIQGAAFDHVRIDASTAGVEAIRACLADDAFVAARFRLADAAS